MAVVGTVLINSVFNFYTDEFVNQMDTYFNGDLRRDLLNSMTALDFAAEQKSILKAYGAFLGIDVYRNYYILDMNGDFIDGSSEELGTKLVKTSNMLSAMSGTDGKTQLLGSEYSDYAVYLNNGDKECIIYIKDSQEEMQQLSWQLFSIILQAVFFGLIIAVILSFFLAKAITAPIQNLTQGAQLIAAGEFDKDIEVHSKDEIGTLTETFNHMGHVLKHTLEEISGERQKLETVFSYLKDAVIAFSDTGKVININKCARELFGSEYNDDFTIDNMFSLLSVEYARSYVNSLNTESSYVIRDVEYNNKVLDINLGILRYVDKNATHTGCIVVMHDITSRFELDKAQREFVANVSHELRTPLTSIRGATESILLNPEMSPEFRDKFLNMTVDECERMLSIINDLLTLSRFDNNKTQWQVSQFNIKDSLIHICEIMRSEAVAHGNTINLDIRDDIDDMTGDKERIERVIINIISNAIKYTHKNGIIDIRAISDGNDIKIYVRDNGVGIPESDINRLFERFYRVEKSRTSDTGGTGLGLAIAKEIVEAHGGTISIKSRVNKGTIVTIVLPLKSRIEENG
ncbi:MAG: ATP-binding protein [Eubacteriales bacterium]|nr:ATP-binding protein [Eubacteriales bacterium]